MNLKALGDVMIYIHEVFYKKGDVIKMLYTTQREEHSPRHEVEVLWCL